MPHETISIATADGQCPAHLLTPAGAGPWPAVIIYMDAFGMRPALIAQMQGLADAGYCVLVPDTLYRLGPYGPLDPAEVFQGGNLMGVIGPMMATTGNAAAARDSAIAKATPSAPARVTSRLLRSDGQSTTTFAP